MRLVHHFAMGGSTPRMSRQDVDAAVARQIERISEVLPDGTTSVSGSFLLGYSSHDIDLVVLVPDVADAAARLRLVYPPLYEDDWRDDWAAFRSTGPPQVDIVLTKRGTKGDAHHRRAWELILADDDVRAEYERLKAAEMDSLQKAAFFERVVAMLDDPPG